MEAGESPATILGVVTVLGTPRAVQVVRRFVKDLLDADHPSCDDLLVCLNELITNAVVHTASGLGGHVTIAVSETEKETQVDVSDDGGTFSIPQIPATADGEGGRGLRLVEGLCSHWGVRISRQGTTVWFTVPSA